MTREEAIQTLKRLRGTSEAALKRIRYGRREYHERRVAAITVALAYMEGVLDE